MVPGLQFAQAGVKPLNHNVPPVLFTCGTDNFKNYKMKRKERQQCSDSSADCSLPARPSRSFQEKSSWPSDNSMAGGRASERASGRARALEVRSSQRAHAGHKHAWPRPSCPSFPPSHQTGLEAAVCAPSGTRGPPPVATATAPGPTGGISWITCVPPEGGRKEGGGEKGAGPDQLSPLKTQTSG